MDGHIKTKKGDYFYFTIIVNDSSIDEFKDGLSAKQGRFVIDHKMKKQGREILHCVYAERFEKKKKLVHCINSWGKTWEFPKIKEDKIVNVYRVSVLLRKEGGGEFV